MGSSKVQPAWKAMVMTEQKAAKKTATKTTTKKCTSRYGGEGSQCNQTEGHDGPHTCSDLTWN
jgi:hypothetical protein